MKTAEWYSVAAVILSLMTPRHVAASGTCTAARFRDWLDMGCSTLYGGYGAGQTSIPCPCQKQSPHGMPQWWVSEPYVNLCMKDTPLSYTTSSGQKMDFTFYYRTRTKLPAPDAMPNYYSHSSDSRTDIYPGVSNCGTNAAWGNNWDLSIVVWAYQWETNWHISPFGNYYHYLPPDHAPFSQAYEATVMEPSGGVLYFNIASSNSIVLDPRSLVRLLPVSDAGYPTGTLFPAADTNGIYWGDDGSGLKLVYPNGSQEIFGLTAYFPVTNSYSSIVNTGYSDSTCRFLLTQRIDPQGRVTRLGYEPETNNYPNIGYRLRYVVDPDGRTNTFYYNSGFQLSQIVDPYGRTVSLNYYITPGLAGMPSSIVDAVGMTNSFTYQPIVSITNTIGGQQHITYSDNGWISKLTTPYGNTSFLYYQQTESDMIDGFQQRAIYVQEPEGAQQLYYYDHNNPGEPETDVAPTAPGQTNFDDGNAGNYDPTLIHRNSYHWGRRQFAALSGAVTNDLQAAMTYLVLSPSVSQGYFAGALTALTQDDFNKADLKHWLLSSVDNQSITESLSSERDPSPDAAGTTPGLRTWYDYAAKPDGDPEELGSDPKITCIARVLPDGNSQYTVYNYYSTTGFPHPPAGAGFVSNSLSSYSKPGGTIGTLTNRFTYATNSVDLISISNSVGQYVNLGYNGSHQVTAITNALNQVITVSWDSSTFNLTGVQWPSDQSVTLSYGTNDYGRLDSISWSPSGRSFTINSYSNGLPTSVTDDRGLAVNNTWDGLNRLTGTSFPDGTTISNLYDRLDLVGRKDRLGHWTRYEYDGLDHLSVFTNANDAVWQFDWCDCGSLMGILDPLTNWTALNYDNQGNLTNITFPDYSSLTYQFDLAGRMTNAFDGEGRSLQVSYNNQGLPTAIASSTNALLQATYDALNRPVSMTDANGVTVTNTFDALNELLMRTWLGNDGNPVGTEGFGYSAAGLIAYTNLDRQPTHFGLDGAGRITSVTNANHEVIRLGYDSLNHVVSLIDGLQHERTWEYNEYGWLTNKMDGLDRDTLRFAYNANGWVTNRWTPEKGNTGYAYDNAGNLTNITYPQSSIAYAYDADNRLTNMVDAVGTTTFRWTAAGQLAGESNAWAGVNYTYQQGLRTAMTISHGGTNWTQTYGYDSKWRMTNTVSPAGGFIYRYLSSIFNRPSSISLPNGANIVNSYDALGRLKETDLNNWWGHTLDGYTYGFDPLGLRTNIVRNFGLTTNSVSVGYDNIAQITSWLAKEANGVPRLNEQFGFGYDAADNLHLRTNNLLVQTFNADAANELSSVNRNGTFTLSGATPAPATSITVNGQAAQTYGDFTFAATNLSLSGGQNAFTNIAQNVYGLRVTNTFTVDLPQTVNLDFDDNGNLTNDGSRAFGYNSENELTNVFVTGEWRSDFTYDGLGRRRIVRDYAWQGGAWALTDEVRFIYDGYLPVQERDTNDNVLVTYTRGQDLSQSLQGAGGIGGLLARTDANGSTFYHADGAGNITALIYGNENITARYLYGPSGKLLGQWGPMADANEMGFSSMPHDNLSGLSFYPFRAYAPNLQRFLNQDPIQELGGINLYLLAGNDPFNAIDSYGLFLEGFGDWELNTYNSARSAVGNFFDNAFFKTTVQVDPNMYYAATGTVTPFRDANGKDISTHLVAQVGLSPLSAMMMIPLGPEEGALAAGAKCESAAKKMFDAEKAAKAVDDAAETAKRALELRPSVQAVLDSYRAVKEVTQPVKNADLLEALNNASPGNWVKVYEAGVKDGKHIEVHYFRNETTKEVFDVKIKYEEWHQKEFK